ncbi:cell division protein FtsW (lipid II flippase) [Brevibacillus sp. AG162]|uniref:FtsW/RodA/SpoVE family cell cycle protein n=1 Tax=Brevibacillus sp. AG162 TaxID=2572910 RepID=UPI00115395E4|nr:FtsW/RodA/SpoVE family cell cycle protein [Brevibacillus sp. AG162]TQK42279.1 cell division protein FtsW (lipid II flippase) [Brevibacillus sp. AG162]
MSENKRIAHYIKDVCDQIKNKEVHAAIRLELENHFAEKIEDYREAGYREEEATRIAIAEMGDPVAVGQQLHQAHKPRMEWGIVSIVGILLAIGLVTLYSLHIAEDNRNLIGRQLVGIIIGTVVFVAILFWDYSKLKRYSKIVYFVTVILLLYTLLAGKPLNGIQYLDIGDSLLHFIAISPFLFIVALAGIFTEWKERNCYTIVKVILYFLPPCLLLTLSEYEFAVFLYVGGYIALVIAAKPKKLVILSFLAMVFACVGGMVYLFAKPYQLDRLFYFLNPYLEPDGRGYIIIQSLKTIQSASLWGQGFGASLDALPALESDYIFAYMVYIFGPIIGIAFFILGVMLLLRLLYAIRRVKDVYGSFLLSGMIVLFFTPFFWSIFMTVGLVPPISVNLPFVGFGIVHTVLQMALMGLVLNIYRRKDIQPLTKAS